MKYKLPCAAAIFFMTIFYRLGGAWPPCPTPLDPLLKGVLCETIYRVTFTPKDKLAESILFDSCKVSGQEHGGTD